MSSRFVVLGLARPGAAWFVDIARWATAAVLPVEFTKCVSADEARARIGSGRLWSALIVDGAALGVDRDLVAEAAEAGIPTIVVDADPPRRAWTELGVAARIHPGFEPGALLTTLGATATPIERVAPTASAPRPRSTSWQGRLVAVTGPGGAGVSTLAAALAQGAARDVSARGLVLLADLALHADQAVLHHTGDVVPGLPELVDAHRLGTPGAPDVRSLTFALPDRHYDLLLGLRRHRDWTLLRRRSTEVALAGLRGAYRVVIAQVDPDVEGVDTTGSHDVEDRNLLARTVVTAADAVVVVVRPDALGLHRGARCVDELIVHGVAAERLAVVVNRAPRSPSARAEIRAVLARLTSDRVAPPRFVAERRSIGGAVRIGSPLPAAIAQAMAELVDEVTTRAPTVHPDAIPERIRPGTVGTFVEEAP